MYKKIVGCKIIGQYFDKKDMAQCVTKFLHVFKICLGEPGKLNPKYLSESHKKYNL